MLSEWIKKQDLSLTTKAHFKYKEPIYSNRKIENDKHEISVRRLYCLYWYQIKLQDIKRNIFKIRGLIHKKKILILNVCVPNKSFKIYELKADRTERNLKIYKDYNNFSVRNYKTTEI